VSVIQFGSLAQDTITGFEGIVVRRIEHMNKCVRYEIQPVVDEDGQLPDSKMFDGPDLKVMAPPKEDLPPAIKTPNTFKLGVKVKDRIAGLEGIAVLRVKNMYSGDQYGIQPPMNKKREIPDVKVFDESDLEQIDPPLPKKKEKKAKKPPEGPHDHNAAIAR
jgi:hypothetical protein